MSFHSGASNTLPLVISFMPQAPKNFLNIFVISFLHEIIQKFLINFEVVILSIIYLGNICHRDRRT